MFDRPILVIDALNAFSRHYCANPTMSENGEHAGGFVGFIKSVGALCHQFFPKKVIVVWESGGNQKRRDTSGGTYKDGRRPQSLNRYYENDIPNTWENHNKQIALTIEALKHLPIQQIYVKDTEADDVIGYICKYKFTEERVIVVSSDRDLYQLINENVSQWSLNQKKIIDSKEVIEKFGCSPKNFCSVRSFVGDPSDNIKGVKGAGFKTISKRFPEVSGEDFVDVHHLAERARREIQLGSNATIYKLMSECEGEARKNWKLMYLDLGSLNGDQVKKIEHQLGTPAPHPNKMALLRILVREGLRSVEIDTTYLHMKSCLQ